MQRWDFPSNNYGQIYGIADSGVENFRGAPMKSLAREICQNSLDAHVPGQEPARISFRTFEIEKNSIPGIEALEDAFRRALDLWKIQKADTAKKFFTKALKVCGQERIACLRISDFNTSGLTGSREELNTPWCNLIKSTGASDKSGSNGGSFGIGKYAPFACSAFRTVFYSTMDVEGQVASQGVSRLTSFRFDDGGFSQGTGYYGESKCSPMYSQMNLDPDFQRADDEFGTDIFVIGFNHGSEWKQELIASVLDGFLYAVFRGDLIVEIDDTVVSKETLPTLIEKYKAYFDENADNYYAVLTASDEEAKTFTRNIAGKGDVILRMMIRPGLHRKCAMIRKTGMKIMDRDRISGVIPFAGVLYVEGEELNSFLRVMENPQHTAWQPERAEVKSHGRAVIKEIVDFVKASLEEMRQLETQDAIDPSLGEYLAFTEEGKQAEQEDRSEALSDMIKNVEIRTVTKTPYNSNIDQEGEGNTATNAADGPIIEEGLPGEGSGGGTGNGGSSGGGGGGSNQGNGNGPNAGDKKGDNPIDRHKKLTSVAPAKERSMCIDKHRGEYMISFTSSVNATDGEIHVFQSAETQTYDAALIEASCEGQALNVVDNKITGLRFDANTPVKIRVRIDYKDFCALEVKAYGHKV